MNVMHKHHAYDFHNQAHNFKVYKISIKEAAAVPLQALYTLLLYYCMEAVLFFFQNTAHLSEKICHIQQLIEHSRLRPSGPPTLQFQSVTLTNPLCRGKYSGRRITSFTGSHFQCKPGGDTAVNIPEQQTCDVSLRLSAKESDNDEQRSSPHKLFSA